MTIKEKITQEEWELYEILRHPVLFGEFYRNLDAGPHDEEFKYSQYQKDYLGDFNHYVSLCCGRAVGKTLCLTDYILWLLINDVFRNEYILYTVPNKVHLEPVFTNLTKFLRNNSLLQNFIEQKKGINSSTYTITLLSGGQLLCRIAGTSGTGANVVGLHTPIVILDEAGFYPWGTWQELQPVLNSWQDGHKMWVSGVPTGFRENNVLYLADAISDQYSKHSTSAHENPRYTKEDEIRNIKQYGGKDSEDYVHFVLGRHGSPTFAVFDRRLMRIEPYPVYYVKFSGIDIREITEMKARLSAIPQIPNNNLAIMGVDLGYTEPTSVIILYEKNGIFKEHARVVLTKVKYPTQEALIDFLDTRFKPNIIGIDAGNEQGLVQHLMSDDQYVHKNYTKRMIPVKFGAWLELGEDEEGNIMKVKVKPQSVTLLQEYTNSHKIIYSTTDIELITELERMTYTKTPNGEIVYRTMTPKGGKRGDDHNTAALLCATYAYFIVEEFGLTTNRPEIFHYVSWLRA
jgi:hypothetical protein